MRTLTPRDERDLVDLVAAARADKAPLEVVGRGSRRGLGRPVDASTVVDLSGITGITLYEPAELVMTARAGTSLAEIRARLAAHDQRLAFEPIDHAALFGHAPGSGSIGGLVAVNAAGSRRVTAGAARDHLLGFRAVNGLAESFKSGGRVMKNVTGFDLSKLIAGSFGTLAVMTEVTFKVLPRPETEATVAVLGLSDEAGLTLLREASGSPQEVTSLAHLPAEATSLFRGRSATLLRLEGPAVSVAAREAEIVARCRGRGRVEVLEAATSRMLWNDLTEARPVAAGDAPVWRVSVAPSDGAALVAALRSQAMPITSWFYDWAGGLVWLAHAEEASHHAVTLRAEVDRRGGHATLVRASADTRRALPVFHPQPAALAALSARVRSAFDPDRILNPGRMRAEA